MLPQTDSKIEHQRPTLMMIEDPFAQAIEYVSLASLKFAS